MSLEHKLWEGVIYEDLKSGELQASDRGRSYGVYAYYEKTGDNSTTV